MSLWLLIDVIVVAIYVISILYFKSKGFLKASENLFSLILTFCLIPMLLPTFEGVVADSILGETIYDNVENAIMSSDEGKEIELPDFLEMTLEDEIKEIDKAKTDILEKTVENIAGVIIKIISFILLFVLVKLGMILLFKLLALVGKLKLFGFFDKTLGIVMGFVNGTIMVYIACALAVVFVPIEYSAIFKEAISDTLLTEFFYNNNIIINLFL